VVEEAIKKAMEEAERRKVRGRDITPFLLGEINRLTAGDSLLANKYLIENNVRVATQIAVQLAKLRAPRSSSDPAAGI
jgi:pseudouridine-5'-phosphate glycosidase